MNILMTTLGSYGDVYPNVGLAVKLKQRGHRVTLFTNPFYAELARKYDVDFIPIGTLEQYEQFANHPHLFDSHQSVNVFFSTLVIPNIRTAYERLSEHIQPADSVIVSSISVFAARLVQEKKRIPNITVHIMPMAFKSAYESPKNAILTLPDWLPVPARRFYWWAADKFVVDRMIGPELNGFRKEIELPPVNRILTRWGHSPQMVIGLFPSWFASPQPDWPHNTHLTGFPLFEEDEEAEIAAEVQTFLDAGEPPLVFMPGSLMKYADRFFETAVQATQSLGHIAILLSRSVRQIPQNFPDTLRHFDYVPFQRLLPQTKLLIHHGGIGTCAQALRAGVPQLIQPMAYDQTDNAGRLKKLGVGDWIAPKKWCESFLTEKLIALTTSSEVKEQCQRIAHKFNDTDSLMETCRLIESIASFEQ